jgi:hypothetical protein
MHTLVDVNQQSAMEYENDLLNEDLFQAMHIVVMLDENHVLLNNGQYEVDQHQNCTRRDRYHWMVNENDGPWEQHIHHLNHNHNCP